MMKHKVFVALGILGLLFSAKAVMALTLKLTRVGVLSTVGIDYTNIDYTGDIPTFEGVASPSAIVYVGIKTSTNATVAASVSGMWQFRPGVLDPGKSAVVITSGAELLSLTINFNATPSATSSATPTTSPTELPASGVWEYYLPIIGTGLVVFFFGKFLKDRMVAWEGKKER